MLDPYIHMGVSQIETIVTQVWQGTPTGQLIALALDDIVLEMGLPNVWQQENLRLGLLYSSTTSWIRHVLQFALDNNITFEMDVIWFARRRQWDRAIMQAALQYTNHVATLQSINTVRMALNVVWISDITNANGTSLDSRWLTPLRTLPHRNEHKWPCQHSTKPKDWSIWQKFLTALCQNNSRMLLHPVGKWQLSHREWIDTWECFITDNDEELFIKMSQGSKWRRHIKQQDHRVRRFTRYHKEYLQYDTLPTNAGSLKRASYMDHRNYIELTAIDTFPTHRTIDGSMIFPWSGMSPDKASIIGVIRESLNPAYLETSERLDILLREFSQGQIIAVCDGSFFNDSKDAAAAWILETQCRTQWIMGSISTPGSKDDQSAFRSELAGLAAISITLKVLSQCCPSPANVIIACDGLSALRVFTTKKDTLTANFPHADLQSIIVDIWSASSTRPVPIHVKGHQHYGRE
jgi:hypothetical protein